MATGGGGIAGFFSNLGDLFNPKTLPTFVNDQGQISLQRIFDPEFRKARIQEQKDIEVVNRLKAEDARDQLVGQMAARIQTAGNSPNQTRDILIERGVEPVRAGQASQLFANQAQQLAGGQRALEDVLGFDLSRSLSGPQVGQVAAARAQGADTLARQKELRRFAKELRGKGRKKKKPLDPLVKSGIDSSVFTGESNSKATGSKPIPANRGQVVAANNAKVYVDNLPPRVRRMLGSEGEVLVGKAHADINQNIDPIGFVQEPDVKGAGIRSGVDAFGGELHAGVVDDLALQVVQKAKINRAMLIAGLDGAKDPTILAAELEDQLANDIGLTEEEIDAVWESAKSK